jgi:hypothetical protein
MDTKVCDHCGQQFARTWQSYKRWELQKYCSRACSSVYSRGRINSPKGPRLFRDCERCGTTFEKPSNCAVSAWPLRKFCSQECSRFAQRGRPAHNKGVKGKPWSDDRRARVVAGWEKRKYETTSETQSGGTWSKFRRLTLERDDWTCTDCGLRDEEIMTVDHIVPKALAPELRYEMSNLAALCPNCHARKTINDRRTIHESRITTIGQA